MGLVSRVLDKRRLNRNLGIILRDYSLYEQANAVKKNKKDVGAWIELAQELRTIAANSALENEAGWYNKAMQVYKMALEFNPENLTLQMERESFGNHLKDLNYEIG